MPISHVALSSGQSSMCWWGMVLCTVVYSFSELSGLTILASVEKLKLILVLGFKVLYKQTSENMDKVTIG